MKLTRTLRLLATGRPRRPRRTSAAELAAAAGQAPGTRGNRGSVLVLVLGALALISVVTLVYVTVGKGDIRTSTTTAQRANVDGTVHTIADYLNDVISRGTTATFVDGVDNGQEIVIRKTWDYPFVDAWRLSVTPNTPARAFNPTGSYSDPFPGGGPDIRQPYQPWLSSTEAVDLLPAALTPPMQTDLTKDWGMISNFVPDGRFVNLWNLAPYVTTPNGMQRISRFDAAPVRANSNGTPNIPTFTPQFAEMSYGLTLLGANGVSYAAGGPQQLPGGLGQADPNIPAHWTMWQYRANRVAGKDPTFGPSSPEYAPYQWADTDGDGFYDSRWFELVNAFDPANPISILPRDDRFRWFIAAKAIDLGAMVNVNTAMDLRLPARQVAAQKSPLGLYPSDIDLYRILRMNDSFDVYGFVYDQLQSGAGEYYGQYNLAEARGMGERGYNAIRWALTRNSIQVPDATWDLTTTNNAPPDPTRPLSGDERAQYYKYWGGQEGASLYLDGAANRYSLSTHFGNADLLELLTFHGLNNPKITSRLEQVTDGRIGAGGNANLARTGPLRSGRTSANEIGTADDDLPTSNGPGVADKDAWDLAALDPRRRLTTVSIDRSLTATTIAAADRGKLTAAELPTYAPKAADDSNPSDLFTTYCDALLPYSWRTGFWDVNFDRLRTLNYGHHPELALRFAAHLAANFRDMYDRADTEAKAQPGAYTLLLDRNKRNAVNSDASNFPWSLQQNGRLDLGDDRLPVDTETNTNVTDADAINIFGIEAQPFITQVASIFIYTDCPDAAGGDDEYNGTQPPGIGEITIRGDYSGPANPNGPVSEVNHDFIGEILAFQLTNPFDVDIPLSQWDHTDNFEAIQGNTFTEYYLEFNGRLFKFAADLPNAPGEGIVLRKGETRNFYILSNPVSDMQARFNNVGGDATATQPIVPADAVERFIDNQLGLPAVPGYTYDTAEQISGGMRIKPIKLKAMLATTGATTTSSGDLLEPPTQDPNGVNDPRRNVYLWRKLTAQAQPTGSGPRPPARATHMLADRLHDISNVVTLDRRAASGDRTVAGTRADPEPDPPVITPSNTNDNTGFTIALWGSVKRRDNLVATPVGAIPAYCLENRWDTSTSAWNLAETDGAQPDALSKSDFSGPLNADRTVGAFLDKVILPLGTPPSRPPGNNPGFFNNGVFIVAKNSPYRTITAPAHLKQHAAHAIASNSNTIPYSKLYPQLHLDNNKFEEALGVQAPIPTVSTLRIADMLLPLAIGPEYAPGNSPPAITGGNSIPPAQCLTLAESLAIALNYSDVPAGSPFSIYNRIGDNTLPPHAAIPSAGAVDRGHLNLTDFPPYEDNNTNGSFDADSDVLRWPGIPMGLNVLNLFTTMDPQFGGLTKGAPGRVNLNTASLPVLRTIPLLSPSNDTTSLPTGAAMEWDNFKALAGLSGTETLPDVTSDIAAALVAWRDKTRVLTRDATNPGIPNFEDSIIDPFVAAGADGRRITTKMEVIREATGFATVGELMAVTQRKLFGGPVPPVDPRLRATDQIDLLGSDNNRSGTKGTASVLFSNPVLQGATKNVDGVTDDYAEKLTVAQAALNSVSVRSDVFAVWFIVHGYQKSDTENLGANDPLVPSIAKRFVMVLDRSSVTRAGEKAKVLLFTEVPMTAQ